MRIIDQTLDSLEIYFSIASSKTLVWKFRPLKWVVLSVTFASAPSKFKPAGEPVWDVEIYLRKCAGSRALKT